MSRHEGVVSSPPSLQYLALNWSLSHVDIQCTHWFVPIQIIFIAFNKDLQNLIGLQRFYEFDGIFGHTTSTLKVPLLPVGLLLKLLSEAMRCLLSIVVDVLSSLSEDQALKLLAITSNVLSYWGLGLLFCTEADNCFWTVYMSSYLSHRTVQYEVHSLAGQQSRQIKSCALATSRVAH